MEEKEMKLLIAGNNLIKQNDFTFLFLQKLPTFHLSRVKTTTMCHFEDSQVDPIYIEDSRVEPIYFEDYQIEPIYLNALRIKLRLTEVNSHLHTTRPQPIDLTNNSMEYRK
jgi:hypothetical protein